MERNIRNGRSYKRELCYCRKQNKTELNGKPVPQLLRKSRKNEDSIFMSERVDLNIFIY